MKKEIFKNQLSENEKNELHKFLKKIFRKKSKEFNSKIKLVKSKAPEHSFEFNNEDSNIIWLFLRTNEVYSYIYKNSEQLTIDTNTAFGVFPNSYSPQKLLLPSYGQMKITVFSQVRTLLNKVDILKWAEPTNDQYLSEAIGKPQLFFLHPTLSEEVKKKILSQQFSNQKNNAFTIGGSISVDDKFKLLEYLIAAYFIEIPAKLKYGQNKEIISQFLDKYKELSGNEYSKFPKDLKFIIDLKGNFIKISEKAPSCFYNKALQEAL